MARYNAIYGSFAALPLFLLWVHISWTICLFGAEFTYASQNLRNFSFDKDTRNISRRYHDFVAILIMSRIAKRFANNEFPYSAQELSEECQIPISLTNKVLCELKHKNVKLIHEVSSDEKSEEITYQPSIDINKLNVAMLLDRLDTCGSEDFKIDTTNTYSEQWNVLMQARQDYYNGSSKVLLKDL